MKKLLLASVILAFTSSLYAQFPGGGKGKSAPNMGHVYGKLVDSLDKPVGEASVVLLQSKFDSTTKKKKEVLLKGLVTKANGEFNFEDLPMFGPLKLKISAIGYKPYETTVSFQFKMDANAAPKPTGDASQQMNAAMNALNAFDKDLGNIKLVQDANQLQNVTVVSSTPGLKMDIDKKVFNVSKDIVSSGGTALDVMRNVPSIQVDIDGNVKMRNATPQIYVDGRPTTLTLDQIPADAIESVEVITNPSAKYDASGGTAGILNIILKKNKKSGYNGNFMAGVDKRGAVNGGGSFSFRQNKVNFTGTFFANQMKNRTTGTTDRTNFGDTQTHIYQENYDKTDGAFLFGNIGLDYFVTNRTTLSLAFRKVHGEFKPTSVLDFYTDSLYDSGPVTSYSQRNSASTREFNAGGVTFGMKHNFAKEGENISADANYFSGKNNSTAMYTTDYYDTGGKISGTQQQQVIADGKNSFFTIQTDYTNPLTKTTKLEAGLRAQLRNIVNDNNTYVQYPGGDNFVKLPGATNNYKNNDNVYAAYATITSSIKDFGYQVGLRAESSNYSGELTNTGEKFSNSYPISLFPSIFLSQKLKNRQELQLSYTRRVNRPNFFQLIPYTDYTDSLNITRGNPDLVPEFTTSLEMSYSKTFKKNHNILVSLYYKHTNDLITRYLDTAMNPVSGKTDLINTYVNANSSQTYGSEFTSTNPIVKWLDMTTNINVYNSEINTDNIASATSQPALWSWFGKWNGNFKLPKNYTIQLSATYQSKTNLPINRGGQGFGGPGGGGQAQSSSQGYIEPFWGMDIAFKKTFLKNNAASVTLSVSDIFKTRVSEQYSYSQFFEQTYTRINNPQMIRLNFTYRFGKMDVSLFKRQNTKSSGAQDAMQMGGQ